MLSKLDYAEASAPTSTYAFQAYARRKRKYVQLNEATREMQLGRFEMLVCGACAIGASRDSSHYFSDASCTVS